MRLKHLMIISLALIILTIGAVSASDESAADNNLSQSVSDDLTVNEITEDTLSESESDDLAASESSEDDVSKQSEDDSVVCASESSQEILGDYYSNKVHIEVYDTVDISDSYYSLGYVEDEDGIKGTISVSIDGKNVFTKKFTQGSNTFFSVNKDILNLKNYKYGYHTVKITYNDGKAKSDSRKVNFVSIPEIYAPYMMAVGENNGVIIKGNPSMSGTATVYIKEIVGYDAYKSPIYQKGAAISTVKIVNGYAFVPLKNLNVGEQNFQLDYAFGTYSDSYDFTVIVGNNDPGFISSISANSITFGKSVTLKVTGPKSSNYMYIYVDGKFLKSVKFGSGYIKEVISGLSEGTHYISVNYDTYDGTAFYSNTFKVTVKSNVKLTLKKVAVKKSAKKLTLSATLKINGKVAKNKKLIFKFNKKTYAAKTNKKGVAKVTIKKAVLKKLKVGGKVSYQVSYGKTVKKLSVKVVK